MEQEGNITTDKKNENKKIKQALFWLWEFVCTEGLHEEAEDFLLSHKDTETPFDWL